MFSGKSLKVLVCAIVLASSLFILASKLANPSKIEIIISGEETLIREVPNLYTWEDVSLMVMAALAAGASLALLVRYSLEPRAPSELGDLTSSEKLILDMILKDGGSILQSDLVKKSGLPKSTVSIVLSRLEAKGIIERRRKGLGNLIIVKSAKD